MSTRLAPRPQRKEDARNSGAGDCYGGAVCVLCSASSREDATEGTPLFLPRASLRSLELREGGPHLARLRVRLPAAERRRQEISGAGGERGRERERERERAASAEGPLEWAGRRQARGARRAPSPRPASPPWRRSARRERAAPVRAERAPAGVSRTRRGRVEESGARAPGPWPSRARCQAPRCTTLPRPRARPVGAGRPPC